MGNYRAFYIVVSVLLLIAAGAITWFTSRSSEPVSPGDTTSNWICEGCGEHYALTDKQLAQWDADPKRFEIRSVAKTPASFVVYSCEKCNQLSVVAAQECLDHGTWNPVRHLDGKPGGCPECAAQMKRRR